jgi:hypothetical protein
VQGQCIAGTQNSAFTRTLSDCHLPEPGNYSKMFLCKKNTRTRFSVVIFSDNTFMLEAQRVWSWENYLNNFGFKR